jgi:hypothetical protein
MFLEQHRKKKSENRGMGRILGPKREREREKVRGG